MTLKIKITNAVLYYFFRLICKVDADEIKQKVPMQGPLILAINHTSAVEAPVVVSHLFPRPVSGLGKVESWKNPLFHYLFDLYGVIPVRRGEADLNAMQKMQEALTANKVLCIAPEGTRSYDGCLQKGFPGAILVALRSGAPIQPMAAFGHQDFWKNLKRLRRTPFHIRVGRPFCLDSRGRGLSKDVRQQMADEMMYQLAALLPARFRGVYADRSKATEEYLVFAPGVESNLADWDRLGESG